jgi:hypothetical protein
VGNSMLLLVQLIVTRGAYENSRLGYCINYLLVPGLYLRDFSIVVLLVTNDACVRCCCRDRFVTAAFWQPVYNCFSALVSFLYLFAKQDSIRLLGKLCSRKCFL